MTPIDQFNPSLRDDAPAAPSELLRLDGVTFRYPGGHAAVDGVSLSLGPGILGLLGPNGAGKSSMMRMLATLTRPTQGRILWKGEDIARKPDALRVALGYLPQDFGVYPALSAREFLRYLAAVKGLPHKLARDRVDQCLEQVGLAADAERRLGDFSGGMRQRVGIAQALLNDPQLLIADEPTVGLDPGERLRFRHLLTELGGQRLVILCTHIVSDVEASATALAVMRNGRLIFSGTPDALLARADGKVWDWTVAPERLEQVRAAYHVSNSLRRPDGVRVRLMSPQAPAPEAEAVAPSLEDAYVSLLADADGA
jgi:ABC-2 type transport system ATP-binding protein